MKKLLVLQFCLVGLFVVSLYIEANWNLRVKEQQKTSLKALNFSQYLQMCTLARHVVFVKTHKTGSTTTATMLERYGEKHSLVFALPKVGHIFSSTELFKRSMVTKLRPEITLNEGLLNYDIITNHARYNRAEMDAMIPNATYITILREPTAHLESVFGYFGFAKKWGLDDSPNALKVFMDNPKVYVDKKILNSNLAWNGQLYDLGLDHRYHSNQSILDYIRQLENEFDLVMIMEYYDESLILLKQTLCLEYDDIIYFKKGERKKEDKYEVTPLLHKKMHLWNSYDVKLYNRFNETFWRKVNVDRKRFDQELNEFRQLQHVVTEKCVEHVTLDDGSSKRRIPLHLNRM